MSQDHSFDFDDTTFERVEVAGGILLASAEVDYGELFTEVIWDGLITAEKRARLDRAAEVFGLDRDRVRRIEQGLGAAYEARHRVRVQEEAPPSGTGVPFAGMAESPDAFEPAATAFRPTQPPPGHRSSVPSAPLLQAPAAAAVPLEPARPAPVESAAAGDARRSADHWAAAAQPVGAQPAWPAPPREGPTPSGGFHPPPPRPPEPSWQEQSAAAAKGSWQDHPPQGWQDAPRATQASWPHAPPQQPPQLGEVSWEEEEEEAPPAMRLPIAHDATVQEDAPPWTATQEMSPPQDVAWRDGQVPVPDAQLPRFADEQPFPSQPPPWMPPASSPPAAPQPLPPINELPTPSGGFMAPTSIAPLGAEVRAGLEESRPSFSPFAAAVDEPHLYALQRRIAFLESQNQTLRAQNSELSSRLGELEREVDLVRRGTIDVDLAGSDEHAAARPSADPASLHRAVVEQPRDPERTRALFRALKRASDADRRWCTAQVLQVLDQSPSSDERAAFEQHRTPGLIKPAKSMTAELWRSLLLHPDEDPLCGDIFAAIVPAVLLTRAATQRRERNAPVLDPANKVDPTGSTLQAVRCVAWAAAILGMEPPPIYMERDWGGMFETVVAVPPAARVGRLALSGRSPSELAFAAGRHLSWYRHDHIIVKLTGSTRELEDLFLAAFTIGNPGLPIVADVRSRVEPVARAIEPLLEPPSIARLKHHVFAFIEQGGRTHLRRWAMAADRTAARAGLLLANDLAAARTMLELEDPRRAPALYEDLIVFASSERYTELRHRLGIAIGG